MYFVCSRSDYFRKIKDKKNFIHYLYYLFPGRRLIRSAASGDFEFFQREPLLDKYERAI